MIERFAAAVINGLTKVQQELMDFDEVVDIVGQAKTVEDARLRVRVAAEKKEQWLNFMEEAHQQLPDAQEF